MTNKLPNPNNRTSCWFSLFLSLLLVLPFGFELLAAQENSPSSDSQPPLKAEKPSALSPEAAKMARQARQTLQQARTRIESYDSLKADLLETVLIGTKRFQSTGSYLQASGNRIRMELKLELRGADGKPLEGSLLEVSDGSLMHSSHRIADQQQISRRDVNNIFTAIEKYPSIDSELLRAKLGIGGLPALLASLEKSFQFTEYKLENIQDSQYIMIGGGWNAKYLKRNRPKDLADDAPLPPYVPDYVRVYFDESSLFPRRIFYFKKLDNKLNPMLTLDFQNVQQNVPLGKNDFAYAPPEGVVPTDITQDMIDMIIQSYQRQQQRESEQQTPPASAPQPGKPSETPEKTGS